ncbi:hypothetical protein D5S17_29920 [Pseudonocardiaceae bacterium YIM PH 21723]|nr:hypothetical protein D5S17_29920 [Pseudonocardiaceae bacterium YIM PH 21723]
MRDLVCALLIALSVAASTLLYRSFFATTGYLWILLTVTLCAAALAAVSARLRWGAGILGVAGFTVLAGYLLFPASLGSGLPTIRTAHDLGHALLSGWSRMLTIALPADVSGILLATPALLSWSATFVAVLLTLRTRLRLVPLLPPVLTFIISLGLTGAQPAAHLAATATFLVVAVVYLVIRTAAVQPVGALIAVACLALGLSAAPALSAENRFDPRALRPLPVDVTEAANPLSLIKPQLKTEPAQHLFTVRTTPEVDRMRIAALDQYDGRRWTESHTYRPLGTRLTGTDGQHTQVEIAALTGPYLPVSGTITALTGLTLPAGIDTGRDTLVSTAPMLRGLRYELTGTSPRRDDRLDRATPAVTPELTRLPSDMPADMTALAHRITDDKPTAYRKALALAEFLAERTASTDTPAGHSLAALRSTVITGQEPGYAEQRAAAFTVLARSIGLPARVAVGYRLQNPVGDRFTVTTGNADAWSEVDFQGVGWVPFDTTGQYLGTQRPPAPEPPIVAPAPSPQRPAPLPQAGDGQDRRPEATPAQPVAGAIWAGIGSGALLLALVGSVVTAKTVRRRRRRRRGVLGAWSEMTDRLVERGVTAPWSATTSEIAELAHHSLAVSTPRAATSLVDMAIYAPHLTSTSDAELAWTLEDRLRAELYPQPLSLRRLLSTLDPRPLLRKAGI